MVAKLGLILGIASSAIGAVGAMSSPSAQASAQEAEAEAMEKRAAWKRAQGQHEGERKRKETSMVVGRQKALMAMGGGGITPSGEENVTRTVSQGALQADINIANSEEQARGEEDNAAAKRAAASATRTAGMISGVSGILSGVSGFAKQGSFYSSSRRAG